jgi:hypothetical protein
LAFGIDASGKLNLPYFTLNIISGIISASGVWLFLRYSPFPLDYQITFSVFILRFFSVWSCSQKLLLNSARAVSDSH